MSYYRICPDCGCSLDPGERCDCQDKEEAAPDATNIQSGKRMDQKLTDPRSISDFIKRLEEMQV